MKIHEKICLFAGIALALSSAVLISVERTVNHGSFVPAAVGAGLIVLAVFGKFFRRHRGWKITARLLFCLAAGIYLLAEGAVFGGSHPSPPGRHDYAVVLGCGLNGDQPSLLLEERLKTALQYARQYPDSILVLSGGQGADEAVSEAEAMRRYLAARGVPEERMLLESRSTSTYENFYFTRQLLGERDGQPEHDCVFISNGFHLYRAGYLASLAGLNAVPCAAATPVHPVSMYFREGLAVLYTWVFYR